MLEQKRKEKLQQEEEARKKRELEEARKQNLQSPEKKDENGQTTLHRMAAELGKFRQLPVIRFSYLLLDDFHIVKLVFIIKTTIACHILVEVNDCFFKTLHIAV